MHPRDWVSARAIGWRVFRWSGRANDLVSGEPLDRRGGDAQVFATGAVPPAEE